MSTSQSQGIELPLYWSSHLHFSPDSSQIAVRPEVPERSAVEVYTVSNLARVVVFDVTSDRWFLTNRMLAHLGDAVVYLEWSLVPAGSLRRSWRLVRHRLPDGPREVLLDGVEGHDWLLGLGSTPDGFIVVAPDRVWLGRSTGPVTEHRIAAFDGKAMRLLANDRGTGRFAVLLDYTELAVLAVDLTILARIPLTPGQPEASAAWFCGPDVLVTWGHRTMLHAFRIVDGGLVKSGEAYVDKYVVQHNDFFDAPLGVTAFASRGLIGFARGESERPIFWYDAKTLEPASEPAPFGDRFPMWLSPDETRVPGVSVIKII